MIPKPTETDEQIDAAASAAERRRLHSFRLHEVWSEQPADGWDDPPLPSTDTRQ